MEAALGFVQVARNFASRVEALGFEQVEPGSSVLSSLLPWIPAISCYRTGPSWVALVSGVSCYPGCTFCPLVPCNEFPPQKGAVEPLCYRCDFAQRRFCIVHELLNTRVTLWKASMCLVLLILLMAKVVEWSGMEQAKPSVQPFHHVMRTPQNLSIDLLSKPARLLMVRRVGYSSLMFQADRSLGFGQ